MSNVSTDGTFIEHSGYNSTSFDSFLQAMGSESSFNDGFNDFNDFNEESNSFDLEEAKSMASEFLDEHESVDETNEDWDTQSEEEKSIQELEDLLKEDEDEEEEDGEDSEEVNVSEEEEAYDYLMDDWDSNIVLPNGVEISAAELKEIKDLSETKSQLESRIGEISHKEKLLAENTNFGIQAIQAMESQLMAKARTGPLSDIESLQYNTLQQMKAYMDNATGQFKNMYSTQIAQQEAQAEQVFNDNVERVFRKHPNIQEDISEIKEYLAEKGMKDPHGYLTQIKMDPLVIDILQDALNVHKVKKHIGNGTKKVSRAMKGKTTANVSVNKEVPFEAYGVSSHDKDSFKSFMDVMRKENFF